MAELISSAEAARRLGVKPATLYSYVSRGLLQRRRAPGGRASLFDAGEVASLAARGRSRPRPGPGELVIESRVTEIRGDQLRFRGVDALLLAGRCRFEEVAEFLWGGPAPGAGQGAGAPAAGAAVRGQHPAGVQEPGAAVRGQDPAAPPGWEAGEASRAAATAAQVALPAGTLPLERLRVIVPALAAGDPFRLQLSPPAVRAAGRSIIAGMVDCLPPAGEAARPAAGGSAAEPGDGAERRGAAPPGAGAAGAAPAGWPAPGGGPVASRLWGRLCPRPAGPGLLALLESALVLLADHELAASTFAARVAASVRADPYAVVATGLGAVGGALHGGASLGAELMLASAREPADAPRVVGDVLRRGERIPGLGHFVYTSADPRAGYLLSALRRAAPASPRLAAAEAILGETARRGVPQPNADFALAVFTSVAGMVPGAAEAIFAVARAAGWIAHALEAYADGTPLRPRASYPGESEPAAPPFP